MSFDTHESTGAAASFRFPVAGYASSDPTSNEYLTAVVAPDLISEPYVPDLVLTPRVSKSLLYSQVLTGVPKGLLWIRPSQAVQQISLYTWNGARWMYQRELTADENLGDSFTFARAVAMRTSVKSSTVSSGVFTVSGNTWGVQYQAPFDFSSYSTDAFIAQRLDETSALAGVPIADGLTVVSTPSFETDFHPIPTPQVAPGGNTLSLNYQYGNTEPALGGPGFLTGVVTNTPFDTNNAPGLIPPMLTGLIDISLTGFAVNSEYAIGVNLWVYSDDKPNTFGDGGVQVYGTSFAGGLDRASMISAGALRVTHNCLAPINRVKVEWFHFVTGGGLALNPGNAALSVTLTSGEYYSGPASAAGSFIVWDGVDEKQQIVVSAVQRLEAIPNAVLARNLRSAVPFVDNLGDLLAAKYVLSHKDQFNLRSVYRNSDYAERLTNKSFSNMSVRGAIVGRAGGFTDFMSTVGRALRPHVGPAVGSVMSAFGAGAYAPPLISGLKAIGLAGAHTRKGKIGYASSDVKMGAAPPTAVPQPPSDAGTWRDTLRYWQFARTRGLNPLDPVTEDRYEEYLALRPPRPALGRAASKAAELKADPSPSGFLNSSSFDYTCVCGRILKGVPRLAYPLAVRLRMCKHPAPSIDPHSTHDTKEDAVFVKRPIGRASSATLGAPRLMMKRREAKAVVAPSSVIMFAEEKYPDYHKRTDPRLLFAYSNTSMTRPGLYAATFGLVDDTAEATPASVIVSDVPFRADAYREPVRYSNHTITNIHGTEINVFVHDILEPDAAAQVLTAASLSTTGAYVTMNCQVERIVGESLGLAAAVAFLGLPVHGVYSGGISVISKYQGVILAPVNGVAPKLRMAVSIGRPLFMALDEQDTADVPKRSPLDLLFLGPSMTAVNLLGTISDAFSGVKVGTSIPAGEKPPRGIVTEEEYSGLLDDLDRLLNEYKASGQQSQAADTVFARYLADPSYGVSKAADLVSALKSVDAYLAQFRSGGKAEKRKAAFEDFEAKKGIKTGARTDLGHKPSAKKGGGGSNKEDVGVERLSKLPLTILKQLYREFKDSFPEVLHTISNQEKQLRMNPRMDAGSKAALMKKMANKMAMAVAKAASANPETVRSALARFSAPDSEEKRESTTTAPAGETGDDDDDEPEGLELASL